MIKQYGKAHPESGLHKKTKGYHFASSLEVYDPITLKKVKKDFKPFLIDNSVLVFEREKIILNDSDKVLKRQLNAYKIIRIGSNGRPIFSSEDEHSVDTLALCLLIFQIEYSNLFKLIVKGAFGKVNFNKNIEEEWNNREIEKKVVNNSQYEFLDRDAIIRKPKKKTNRGTGRFKRSMW